MGVDWTSRDSQVSWGGTSGGLTGLHETARLVGGGGGGGGWGGEVNN